MQKLTKLGPTQLAILSTDLNWASEASPTLGCSIEISRDIMYDTMSVCLSYVKLTA